MNIENEILLGRINDAARSVLTRDRCHNIVIYMNGEGGDEEGIRTIVPADASADAIRSKLRLMEPEWYAVVREVPNGRTRILRVLLVTKDDGMGEIITEFRRVAGGVVLLQSQRDAEVMESAWSIWGSKQIDLGGDEDDDDDDGEGC